MASGANPAARTLARLSGIATVMAGLAVAVVTLRFFDDVPLGLALAGVGVALALVGLGAGILALRSRAAWSFATALHGVIAIVTLLAAPALRRAGSDLLAFAPPAFFLALVVLVYVSGEDF